MIEIERQTESKTERKSKQRKMDSKDRHIRTYRQTENNTWYQEILMNKKVKYNK